MCEYCEKGKALNSCNFCGDAKITIHKKGFQKDIGMLEVQGNENTFKLFKRTYCPRFDITYCPICGRKLGEE